ncbi:MAG: NAD(P)H-hydrate dehydratase [Chitinophagales bacterium]|nr:NAD(P)H-hydrate dehydratase [Chitinophagales bacterium]
MKILSASQIREADAYTIRHEPIASIALMERAARAFVQVFSAHISWRKRRICVVCGIGNNGGDGLAIARLLHAHASVKVLIVGDPLKSSPDFKTNLERLAHTSVDVYYADQQPFLPLLQDADIIIDAIFGTGLSRKAEGIFQEVIHAINALRKTVVSVDIPSGLYCDEPNKPEEAIVQATHTITFQLPKFTFFFPETGKYCGSIHIADIGLNKHFLENAQSHIFFTEVRDIAKENLYERPKFSHKGNFGHLLLAAGSKGKAGAAILCARAAMRCGVGLLTIRTPSVNLISLQTAIPEAMCICDDEPDFITSIDADFASAFAIGPGLGLHPSTLQALKIFLSHNDKPVVLDADALNLLSSQPDKDMLLRPNTVITPHPKEFDRLAGPSENSFQRLDKALELAKSHSLVVVLKGAFTAVVNPEGTIHFNSTGNPGMATAGSGDVLTGIIGALLAQGYPPFNLFKPAYIGTV